MNCLKNMIGALPSVRIHGIVSLILFALATSIAAAENWDAGNVAGCGGPLVESSGKVVVGEEKHSRYRPMKKTSFPAQQVKRTH